MWEIAMSKNMQKKNRRKGKGKGTKKDMSLVKVSNFSKLPKKEVLFKDIVPPSVIVRLKYLVNRRLNNAGLNTASIQLRANGLYDVDPAIASTPVPGFVEWMTMFQRYRVLKVKSTCRFVALDGSIPPIVNLGMGNTFHAANAKTIGYFEGSDQKTQIANINNAGIQLSMTRSSPEIIGDMEADAEEQYIGTNATNPVNLWFVSIAADVSYLGAAYVNGLGIRWETEFYAEFYLRRNLFN
jgi:hypothetical protein